MWNTLSNCTEKTVLAQYAQQNHALLYVMFNDKCNVICFRAAALELQLRLFCKSCAFHWHQSIRKHLCACEVVYFKTTRVIYNVRWRQMTGECKPLKTEIQSPVIWTSHWAPIEFFTPYFPEPYPSLWAQWIRKHVCACKVAWSKRHFKAAIRVIYNLRWW